MTGFKGRSGKSFRARLALQQGEDGKWRVEFDEPWAREGAKPPEGEDPAAGGRGRDAGHRGAGRGGLTLARLRRGGLALRAAPRRGPGRRRRRGSRLSSAGHSSRAA